MAAVLLSTSQEEPMRKKQVLTSKGTPRQAGSKPPSGDLQTPTESKISGSGITQPHSAKKVALGPNTNR